MLDKLVCERTFWERQVCYAGLMSRYLIYIRAFEPDIERQFNRVLDVGCGPMPFALFLNTGEIHTVDPLVFDFMRMPQWKRFWSTSMQAHNGLDAVLPNSADCVLLVNLLDHISPEEWVGFMEEVLQKMEAGGYLFGFTHIRDKPDQFHYPTKVEQINALLSKPWIQKVVQIKNVVLDRDAAWPPHWTDKAWVFVGKKV